ncbi:MAG: oligoendopeptidase F, partial [Nitrososphaeraceae archaeon]
MLTYDAMKLGKWNLADLVPSSTAKEVGGLLSNIESKVSRFEGMRPFLKPEISVDVFVEMIHMIEEISEELSILAAFAHLQYYADTSSNDAAAFMTRIEKFCSEIGNRLIFFDLWFKKDLDNTNALRLIDGAPRDYKEYLRHKRLAAKYSLTEPEEKIINTLEVSGTGALV